MPPIATKVKRLVVDEGADKEEPEYWSRTLIAVAIASVVVATISFLLRLYSRRKTTWKPAIEDALMCIGLVFSYLLSACVIIAALNGVGYNIWALPRQTQSRVALVFWLGQKCWALAHVFIKLSIIFLIRRILYLVGPWRSITTGLIYFTIAWGITNIVGNALQCLPPRFFWVRTISGQCPDNQQAFAISMGSIALAEDVILLLVPIAIVWKMQLVQAEKIRITVLFSLGGVVCVFGILRVVELIHYQAENLTASGAFEVIWAVLEINLAIVCACMVLMRPLLHSCRVFVGRRFSRSKEASDSTSSTQNVFDFNRSSWGSSTPLDVSGEGLQFP